MVRLNRIYTRTGDAGETGLGDGTRVPKTDPRIEAYGTVDELSSLLGAALAAGLDDDVAAVVAAVQNELFHLGAELATPRDGDETAGEPPSGPRIEARHVERLEAAQERWLDELPPLTNFVLPGGTPAAAQLHVARTVCRRAERRLVALAAEEPVPAEAVRYLNRLSDLLFTAARTENRRRGVEEPVWDSRA